jgi:outer membrane receptor for ferric coprogen and ferric-rhodotorulic acid
VTVTAQEERGATSEGTNSFAARAVSINKGDQALKDIPQSISVITHKQIEEQASPTSSRPPTSPPAPWA